MSWAFAVVLIVLIAVGGAVLRSRYNAINGYGTDNQGNPVGTSQREHELEREVEELKERLEVLERIATSEREAKRLSNEIDKLRED